MDIEWDITNDSFFFSTKVMDTTATNIKYKTKYQKIFKTELLKY